MSKRINVTFDDNTAKIITEISSKERISESEVVRRYYYEGYKVKMSSDNLDLIVNIIRTQLKDVMQPSIERICSLLAKTCVSSAQSSILTAETIAKFVPLDQQAEFKYTYDKARLKAKEYTKTKVNDLLD